MLLKADVFFGEIKCRSCKEINKYYALTPEGTDRIKILIENEVIDISDLGLKKA